MSKLTVEFNNLIYEYLHRNGYSNTARQFETEAKIEPQKINYERMVVEKSGHPSTLRKWYDYFVEIAEARSGSPYHAASSHRIEGIMISLEHELRRHGAVVDLFAKKGNSLYVEKKEECNLEAGSKENVRSTESIKYASLPSHSNYARFNLTLILDKHMNILVQETQLVENTIFISDGFSIYYAAITDEMATFTKLSDGHSGIKNMVITYLDSPNHFHVSFITNSYLVKIYEITGTSYAHGATLQHNAIIKSVATNHSLVFILDVTGFVTIYELQGMAVCAELFSKKIIYELVGCKSGRLVLVDSTNVVMEYDVPTHSVVMEQRHSMEPVVSVKSEFIFVANSMIYVYKNGIGERNHVYTVKAEPKVIDFTIFKEKFLALKRNELIFDDTRIEIDKGHSIYSYGEKLILVTDEGRIQIYK